MKISVILSILCIGLGIAIGWIVKPGNQASDSDVAKADAPAASNRKDSPSPKPPVAGSDRNPAPSARVAGGGEPREITGEQREQMEKYQNRFGNMMKKRRMAKLDARISKLVASLNLTPDQEAALRKAAEESLGDMSSIMSGGFDPSKLTSLSGEGSLDKALEDILTDDQKTEHEAFKKRELANKVEARALKDLAKLSGLDMTQEQKDAAYDVLYKQSEESTGNTSAENGILSMVTDSLGIELNIDAGDLGISGALIPSGDSEEADADIARDPRKIMERMQENRKNQIDTKVEAMRPVLNDSQLDQYRKSLELKNNGILGGFMGGFGDRDNGE